MQCPFCYPQVESEPIVGRNKHCIAIDVGHNILVGSRTIVPRQHRISPFNLTEEEITATFELLRAAKAEIDASISPDGYSLGWNCGSSAGQEVEHAPPSCNSPISGRTTGRQGYPILDKARAQSPWRGRVTARASGLLTLQASCSVWKARVAVCWRSIELGQAAAPRSLQHQQGPAM